MNPYLTRDEAFLDRERQQDQHEQWVEQMEKSGMPLVMDAHEPICKPMPAPAYHADKSAWSKGMLWDFRNRRTVCHARHVLGTAPREKVTRKVDIGDVAHVALLQPDKLATHYVTIPPELLSSDGGIRTNAAKDFKAEHESAGRVVLKESEFAVVEAMVKSITTSKAGCWFKAPARIEHAIYWTDPTTDLRCKCRPDFLVVTRDMCVVLDVKTTGDASPFQFQKRAEEHGYWLQDAHYSAGVQATFGMWPTFLFVVVETEWPHACAVYELSRQDKQFASDTRSQLLVDVAGCFETDDWADDWTRDVTTLNLRKYAYQT